MGFFFLVEDGRLKKSQDLRWLISCLGNSISRGGGPGDPQECFSQSSEAFTFNENRWVDALVRILRGQKVLLREEKNRNTEKRENNNNNGMSRLDLKQVSSRSFLEREVGRGERKFNKRQGQ